MCGIVACSTTTGAHAFLLPALRSLEYRGYDSVGIAIRTGNGRVVTLKSTLRIDDLVARVQSWHGAELAHVGIGHTRWATHGDVTEQNAHPHHDCEGQVSVVHNGIIENAELLRAELVSEGHRFASGVDSEVICHLIEDALGRGLDLQRAIESTLTRLTGSWALVVMEAATGRLFAATHRAPLLVATSEHGVFVASDVSAIAPWITQFHVMADGDLVELSSPIRWVIDGIDVIPPEPVGLSWTNAIRALSSTDADFMGREIAEQPETVERILAELAYRVVDGELWRELELPDFDRVAVVGCGTSLNAGRVVARAFGAFGRVPNSTVIASEAAESVLEDRTLIIAASQSGETADVLHALDDLESSQSSTLALTNNLHSSLARRAHGVLSCYAGPEVGVAATKTFVAQVVTGVCLALSSMVASGRLPRADARAIIDDLHRTPARLEHALAVSRQLIPELASQLTGADGFVFLGRGSGVIYAAEGALKLKELTYRWAEHYPAGELKHGPLALVEAGTPVLVVDNGDPRLSANIAEVRSRGGNVITIGGPGRSLPATAAAAVSLLPAGVHSSSFAPCGPLESVVPMQVLARELAIALGRDVDKPRNLAKSVTVE